jgi:hypothetical protein
MSAFGGKADIALTGCHVRFRPKADMGGSGKWARSIVATQKIELVLEQAEHGSVPTAEAA